MESADTSQALDEAEALKVRGSARPSTLERSAAAPTSTRVDASALPRDYELWRQGFVWQRVRLFIWIDLIINPFFALLDFAKTPEAMGALLKVRSVLESGLLICLLALNTRIGRRYPEWIFVPAACLTGLSIAHLTVPTGGFNSFHTNSLAILIVGTTVLAPVRMSMHLIIQLVALTYFFTLNLAVASSRGSVDLHAASQYTFLFWLCFICDLSVFKYEQLQRAEFQARKDLESSNVKLRELDQLKSQFFANVSHELRTPLTLILGSFKHLLGERISDGCRDLVQAGLRNASRLLLHINELLDLAKFESGKVAPIKQCLDLVPLVRQVAANFEASDRSRVHLEGLEQVVLIDADPRLLKKLLYNLLSNAFKFSDPEQGRAWIRLRRMDQFVEFDVEDNGIGIPDDQLTRIFERFTQVEQIGSRRYEGTGIGLALVKEVAEHHGGSVSVVSVVGKGTTFTVKMPSGDVSGKSSVVIDEDAKETIDLLQRYAKAGERDTKRHMPPVPEGDANVPMVLLVEDNPDLSMYLHRLLSKHYRVARATDGCEGLELARACKPDLILTDVMMPRMTGHDLLREVRADAELQGLPVIFLTARGGSEARIESLEAGADDYLTKPFDEGELLARVTNLLKIRAQERELEALNHRLKIRIEEQMLDLMRSGQLKRFLSPQLVNLILSGSADDVLKSHRREIVVVFLDLRGFTSFAEITDPEEVMAVLREYQSAMGELITEFEGTLERFTGDGMMIFFNDPVPVPNPEERAIRMAMAMRQKMGMLQHVWSQRGYQLGHGIGISTGHATLGTIGFEGRWDYAAIGTVTNLSARLCSEAAPGQVLVSHHFLRKIEHLVDVEPIGELTLKGFQRPVTTFNIRRLTVLDRRPV